MCCVRPGVLEAKASFFWLHRILIAVDLPALERPAKAISGTCVFGKSRRWFAVVKKRACQSRDIEWGENAAKEAKMPESYCTIRGYVLLHRKSEAAQNNMSAANRAKF